jgi:uncharacterized protein YbbC (DUF1343 family)
VPFIHGLTIGELATLIQTEELPTLKLTVVKIENYNRVNFFDDEKELKFVAPSPNIASVDAEILYPATVFLEGTNISEGRGTETPFEQIGAPFIDAKKLADELNQQRLDGIRFDTVSFTPKAIKGKSENPKYRDQHCYGVQLSIIDRKKVRPFDVGVAIIVALKKNHAREFQWINKGAFFDKLAGTDRFRQMIDAGKTLVEILDVSEKSIEAFNVRYKKMLLY